MEKKICFIATHAYPLFNPKSKGTFGGSEIQLFVIAKELAKNKKYKISFLVGDFNQKRKEYINNVKLIKTFNPKSANTSILLKSIQAIKYFYILIKENPNVIITSSANSTVGVVGFYCTLFRIKHIHRTASIIDTNKYWIENNKILGKIYKYGLEHANHVVCQTQEQKKALYKNHKINATIFRNVFDFENLRKTKKKDYILWVGRSQRLKKAESFIKLAKNNPNLNFIMILNKQEEDYFKEIKSQAKKLKNLKFIEKVPFYKIQKYYDEAKVFVSTSLYDGFANTFIQSGIGKTPVLTLHSNPDNFINKYECGYFANNSEEKLNEYLNKLIKDKKEYNKLSQNIHNYVKEKYDIKKNITVIKELI
jgi:glycosyltransferase involved in cell wall biosynthesis